MYETKVVFETSVPRKLKVNNSYAHDIISLSGKVLSDITTCPVDEMGRKLPVAVSAFLVEVDKEQALETISEYNVKKIYVVHLEQLTDVQKPESVVLGVPEKKK